MGAFTYQNSVRKSGKGSREGMTLLEVMIALAILAVGLLAMLAMQVSAMRSGKYGRHTTEAAQLARDQMEYLHRLDWSDAAIQPTGWTVDFMGSGAAEVVQVASAGGPQQEMTYNVAYRVTNDALDANLRLVDVRVTWTEMNAPAGAPPRRYAMSTIRHDDP
jgi:type IV pilus modification protein PilV